MFLGEKKWKKKIGHRLPRGVPTWCMHMDLGDIFEHKLKNMSPN